MQEEKKKKTQHENRVAGKLLETSFDRYNNCVGFGALFFHSKFIFFIASLVILFRCATKIIPVVLNCIKLYHDLHGAEQKYISPRQELKAFGGVYYVEDSLGDCVCFATRRRVEQ